MSGLNSHFDVMTVKITTSNLLLACEMLSKLFVKALLSKDNNNNKINSILISLERDQTSKNRKIKA